MGLTLCILIGALLGLAIYYFGPSLSFCTQEDNDDIDKWIGYGTDEWDCGGFELGVVKAFQEARRIREKELLKKRDIINSRERNILFLGIDGVLDTGRCQSKLKVIIQEDKFGHIFDPFAVKNLSKIISETRADVVIYSFSHRRIPCDELIFIQEMWEERHLPGDVIDIYPVDYNDYELLKFKLKIEDQDNVPVNEDVVKGVFIRLWLSLYGENVKNYAIIDSSNNFLPEQQSLFVQTNPEYGISKENAERVIMILNKGE